MFPRKWKTRTGNRKHERYQTTPKEMMFEQLLLHELLQLFNGGFVTPPKLDLPEVEEDGVLFSILPTSFHRELLLSFFIALIPIINECEIHSFFLTPYFCTNICVVNICDSICEWFVALLTFLTQRLPTDLFYALINSLLFGSARRVSRAIFKFICMECLMRNDAIET